MFDEALKFVLEVMQSEYGILGYIDQEGKLICPSINKNIWNPSRVSEKNSIIPPDDWCRIWKKVLLKKEIFCSNTSFVIPEGHFRIYANLAAPIIYRGEVIGLLHVVNKPERYSDKDILYLETIACKIAPAMNAGLERDKQIKERIQLKKTLRKKEEELKVKNKKLDEINIALRILLREKDVFKSEIEEEVYCNINELVMPYIERLKRGKFDDKYKSYLNIVESNLNNITSSFSYKLSSKYINLTPTEIQISNLIKYGNDTKEIADLLGLSKSTIQVHRRNIRHKLGIKNKKTNLRTHLISIP
jgi:DNA-binding CsgD family transcriptional regulator